MFQVNECTTTEPNHSHGFGGLQIRQMAKLILFILDYYYGLIKIDEDEILRSSSEVSGYAIDELSPFLREMQMGEDSEIILGSIEKFLKGKING